MKSLVLLVCSALLLVSVSNGQTLNCNLQNGAGCVSDGQRFFLDYQFTHPGPSTECRRAYNLRVQLTRSDLGFECSFVTDNRPQPNTYRYTVSHNPTNYFDRNTAHINVYGNNGFIKMAEGSGIYENNWWYYRNMHASSGYSWANYRFLTRRLNYYGSNTGIQAQAGHPYGFTPVQQTTYIGLNKRYESNSFGGYGLCQVYCQVIPRSVGVFGRSSSSGNSMTGESLRGPTTPSRPPPPPTGSGK